MKSYYQYSKASNLFFRNCTTRNYLWMTNPDFWFALINTDVRHMPDERIIDDSVKGGLTQFWERFTNDSLHAKILKMSITLLFEDIWVSNWKWGLFENRGSYLTIFNWFKTLRDSKVRTAEYHGKKFRSRLASSFREIVHSSVPILIQAKRRCEE